MLLDRIDNFDIFRPKMNATREILHAIATFTTDISPVLPYVNAELGGWDYDQTNQVLLLKLSDGKWITLHPQKIAIRGIRDLEEAHALLTWIKGQINEVYAAPGGNHPPLYRPGRAQGLGHSEAAAHDQLQGLRLCCVHGLCRGPQGRGDSPGGLSAALGREVPGKARKAASLPGKLWLASPGRGIALPTGL